MQQSNVIFASLFVAFIVYVTVKGELPTYIDLLKGNKTATSGAQAASSPLPFPAGISPTDIEHAAENLVAQSPGIKIDAPAPPSVP